MLVKGIGASGGVAIGKAFVLPAWEWDISDEFIDATQLTAEFEKLYKGIHTSKLELDSIKRDLIEVIGPGESTIFDAQMAILEDPVFMNEVQGIIRRQYKAAEVAVKEAIDKFAGMFDLLDDEYMKERAADIKDVGNRLLKHLIGAPEVAMPEDTQPFVLVAKELTPSQLAHLNPDLVEGIATLTGGVTSHSAIMARALGIPFVIGLEGKLDRTIMTGDVIVLDGHDGTFILDPSDEQLAKYEKRKSRWIKTNQKLKALVHVAAETLDGVRFRLESNISSTRELEFVVQNGADGVGLFRTEFLYMDRDRIPGEEEQLYAYRQAAEALAGKPVTIRTLDIGGDKKPDAIDLPEENNPFLGYRAIRICLDRTDLFKTQLRAILRASAYGNVKLMYPMISSVDEVRKANELLEEAKRDLRRKRVPFNERLPVGITIEVPAAASIADLLAAEVDFFSIGTNDLVQYVLAVDRMNEVVAPLYEPYHPAVLRVLKQVADTAKEAGIGLAVCGEMAGDPHALPIWIGLGIHELSMNIQTLLPLKQRIREIDAAESRKLWAELFRCPTSADILQRLK